MARYLALLGSINIGGNRVKMVDLKAAFAEEGFRELETVAASGNLILTDTREPRTIEEHSECILADRFGFKSCVMVRTKDMKIARIRIGAVACDVIGDPVSRADCFELWDTFENIMADNDIEGIDD